MKKYVFKTPEQRDITDLKSNQEIIAETVDYTIQDVEDVAETIVLNAEDLAVAADTIDLLLNIVMEQQTRIESLENKTNGGIN